MTIAKLLAGASLAFLALTAVPVAHAQNDGDGTTVARPHKAVDPATRAARKAQRKQRREMRRQMKQQQQQGIAPN